MHTYFVSYFFTRSVRSGKEISLAHKCCCIDYPIKTAEDVYKVVTYLGHEAGLDEEVVILNWKELEMEV